MLHRLLLLLAGLVLTGGIAPVSAADPKPLRVLLITGGCCHNYPLQTQQLTNAVAKLDAGRLDRGDGGRQRNARGDFPLR